MKEKNRVLLIEDDENISDILSYSLRKEDFDVRCCFEGIEGIKKIEEFKPQVIILDLMLPDISGFAVCRDISKDYDIPIIMLTARNDIVDKVMGLEFGADDYITKPFDIREVVARIKVALRKSQGSRRHKDYNSYDNKDEIVINKNLIINTESRILYKNKEEIKITPKEYDLLLLFSKNRYKVFSRQQLLDKIWGVDYFGDVRTVDVHIRRLREKINSGDKDEVIETVFGVGYRMR